MDTHDATVRDLARKVEVLTERLDALTQRLDKLLGGTTKKPADPKIWRDAVRHVFEKRPGEWLAVRDVLEVLERAKDPTMVPARAVCSRYLAELTKENEDGTPGLLVRDGSSQRTTIRYRLNPDR